MRGKSTQRTGSGKETRNANQLPSVSVRQSRSVSGLGQGARKFEQADHRHPTSNLDPTFISARHHPPYNKFHEMVVFAMNLEQYGGGREREGNLEIDSGGGLFPRSALPYDVNLRNPNLRNHKTTKQPTQNTTAITMNKLTKPFSALLRCKAKESTRRRRRPRYRMHERFWSIANHQTKESCPHNQLGSP